MKPIPSPGNAAARTALPQPPNTSQNVPVNSAATFGPITLSSLPNGGRLRLAPKKRCSQPGVVGSPRDVHDEAFCIADFHAAGLDPQQPIIGDEPPRSGIEFLYRRAPDERRTVQR